jgi:hypothetical protein
MDVGLERCRCCRNKQTDSLKLTFAHLIPKATLKTKRGGATLGNISILCDPCNRKQGAKVWPTLASLAEEERLAPPTRQWSYLAAWEKGALKGHCRVDPDDELVHFDLDITDEL